MPVGEAGTDTGEDMHPVFKQGHRNKLFFREVYF
jgi:hypothetical protein